MKILVVLLVVFGLIVGVFIVGDKLSGSNNSSNIVESIKTFLGIKDTEEEEVDNRPLETSVNADSVEVLENRASFVVTSNRAISIDESDRLKLVETSEKDANGNLLYVLEVSNLGIGDGVVNLTLKDEKGEEQKHTINVSRLGFNIPFQGDAIQPWPNTTYIADGNNLAAPISKTRRLVSTYAPTDLVNLKKTYINLYINDASFTLRKDAGDALDLMLAALRKERGKNVVIASAYRSYTNQVSTYTGWLKELGQKEADKISARPGYSEHQLGTAVDFFSEDSGFTFTDKFDSSIAGKWLLENAYRYGFVQTYPKGSEKQTGYSYEAWHWRYVGPENADLVKKSGKTLTEWVTQKNN